MNRQIPQAPAGRRGRVRRWLCLALCAALAAAMFPSSAWAAGELIAPNSTRAQGTLANLVIGVRFSDTADENDTLADPAVWQLVRGMYDTDKDSFANYIRTVSEGKLTVQNYFPQETVEAEIAVPFGLLADEAEEEAAGALPEDEPLPEDEAPAGETGEPEENGESAGETSDAGETPDTQPTAEPTASPEPGTDTQPTAEPTAQPTAAPETDPDAQPTAEPAVPPETGSETQPAGTTGGAPAEPSSGPSETAAAPEAQTTGSPAPAEPNAGEQLAVVQPAPPPSALAALGAVRPAAGAQPAQAAGDVEESTVGEPYCATLQLEKTAAEYLKDEKAMIREIIAALDSGSIPLPSDKLDNSAAGFLDNLTIVVPAGTDFYAHSTTYEGSESFQGLRVYYYNLLAANDLVSTLGGTPSISLSGGQGVIAHEFLHTLGLPDLYRKDGSGAPVGIFSIMSSALSDPQYPLEYLREQLGWISPIPEITASGTYTIRLPNVPDQWNGQYPTAYKLRGVRSGYDSEFFVLEHRYKEHPKGSFDRYLTKSGLLMYRVNTGVSALENYKGENYIYVFRENAESVDRADEKVGTANRVVYAPRFPEEGKDYQLNTIPAETSYGSADLDATFRENTLFYSDGANSGIAITDIHYTEDHQLMTFTVTLADPSAGEWQGGGAVDGVGPNCLALAECGGSLYAATTSPIDQGPSTLTLWQRPTSGDADWTEAAVLTGVNVNPTADLLCYNGGLWLATQNASGQPVAYRYQDGALALQYTAPDAYAMQPQLVEYSGSLYLAYCQSGNKALALRRVAGSGPELPALTVSGYLTNPALAVYGGKLAALYSDFGNIHTNTPAADKTSRVAVYSGSGWVPLYDTGIPMGKLHALASDGPELAAFVGNDDKQYGVWAYDGSSWSSLGSPVSGSLQGIQLLYSGGQLYAAVHGSDQTLTFWRWTNGGWEAVGDAVTNAAAYVSRPVALDGRFYQAYLTGTTSSGGGSLVLRQFTPAPAPAVEEDYTVRLFLEAEAAGTTFYVDGVACPAAVENGAVRLQLADGTAKTVTWYPTNENGVPTGMRVWLLEFVRGRYLATEQTALQDLLLYHGFSIRIKGKAGIRYMSSIATETKQALTSAAGLDGYHLVEYGTLVTSDERITAPTKGQKNVQAGRAYWRENGALKDFVYQTANGRQWFTTVQVGIPAAYYKTQITFRGYVILQKGEEQYIFYGPAMHKSIYEVADTLIGMKVYPPTGSAGKFLQKIIDDAV